MTRDLNSIPVYFITSKDGIETHTSSNNIKSNWKAPDGLRLQPTSNVIEEHPPTRQLYKYTLGDKVCYTYGEDWGYNFTITPISHNHMKDARYHFVMPSGEEIVASSKYLDYTE